MNNNPENLSPPPAAPAEAASLPLVSLIVPAYNEAGIIESTLKTLVTYMGGLADRYRWEIVVVNDGSADETGSLADAFAMRNEHIRVLHHPTNFGLGQALRFAFSNCKGDYVLTLDADLSYDAAHIERLLDKIRVSRAKVVIASPYLKGGRISNVPFFRKTLSVTANRFLSLANKEHLSTITSMVRVYDGQFLRSLPLKSMGMDLIPEIIYKAMIMGARIEEIPAHLDWSSFTSATRPRRSSMRVMTHTLAILLSGFLFRPFMFFVIPGLVLLVFSAYVNGWMVAHFAEQFAALADVDGFFSRSSQAVGAAYAASPHTFIIGLLSLMLAVQLIGLGILALQNKSYFEEIFHLGTLHNRSLGQERRHRQNSGPGEGSEAR